MRNTGKQNTSDAITGRRFECTLESQWPPPITNLPLAGKWKFGPKQVHIKG
jgi:hypothetical protein